MATSWAKETEENVNYTKLCRLLYDGGTLAVKTVFDGIIPPASLGVVLRTNRHTLQRLKKPAGRVLSQDQWDQLYPPSGAVPKSEDFDITLLFVLLRNICGLTPPATGWDALPAPTDASLEANLARIKYFRNTVTAHSSKAEVDKTQFEAYWNGISSALLVLGLKQNDINELKSSPLGVKKYNQLVEYWDLSDEEIKQLLENIKASTSRVESDTADVKSRLCDIELQMQNMHKSEVDKLAYIDYSCLIKTNCEKYHPSTRQWVIDQVEDVVQTTRVRDSIVLIRAGPGMGKSIVAAKICEIYHNNGLLGGCHFFQHNNSLRNSPRIMLQSIARQLCNTVPGYQAVLETKLNTLQGKHIADLNCEELFGLLIEEPLSKIDIDHNVVIVIDALDECASQHKEEIEDIFESKLCNLPSWIRFVITTRPLPSCCNLTSAAQVEINDFDQRNEGDIKAYLAFELTQRNAKHYTNKFVDISKGLFLVARFLLDILLDESGKESMPNISDCFLYGIAAIYKHYFKRVESRIKPYLDTSQSEDSFYQMLEAVVASESPIPKEMVYEILHLKSVNDISPEKRKDRYDAMHLFHTIFPVENDHVTVFHKTVTDWLTLNADNQHQFSVSPTSGVEVLAEKSLEVLKAFKERQKPLDQPLGLSDSETFAVQFGICYIIKSFSLCESKIEEILKDVTVVAAFVSLYNLDKPLPDNFTFTANPVKCFLFHLLKFQAAWYIDLEWRKWKICFGYWLSRAGDLLLNFEKSPLSSAQKKELRHWLVENKLPHYSLHYVASNYLSTIRWSLSFVKLLQIANGFVVVSKDKLSIHVCIIKDDGSILESKAFRRSNVLGISPDKKYLIITTCTYSSKIELYDVTTLQKVQEYNFPMDHMYSIHLFGNAEKWYIVGKGTGCPNIYILNGLNGQLDNTIEVRDGIEIMTVNQSGHILMREEIGDSELSALHLCPPADRNTSYNKLSSIYVGKSDFGKLCQYKHPQDNLWLFSYLKRFPRRFSGDGNYLAVSHHNSDNVTVYVYHTNDGTLYRRCELPLTSQVGKIVFLSSSCLIMMYSTSVHLRDFDALSELIFYDLLSNKLMYCASTFFPFYCEPLVVTSEDTKEFISALYAFTNEDNIFKLEFHCLEQNFLDSS